jgi:cobalamin biosynthesis protein CbiD
MTTIHQKNQILESLNSLDQMQTEQVMDYINKLVQSAAIEDAHKRLKREALKEIRLALGSNRKLMPSF